MPFGKSREKDPTVETKTIKMKVSLTPDQEKLFKTLCGDLTWIWNNVRSAALNLHSEQWYNWADKLSNKLCEEEEKLQKRITSGKKIKKKEEIRFLPFSLEGIIRVPIRLGSTAWEGASCAIARGGGYFKKDENITIPYNHKTSGGKIETRYKYGSTWVEGDFPWSPITPKTWEPISVGGEVIDRFNKWDSIKRLNLYIEEENKRREKLSQITRLEIMATDKASAKKKLETKLNNLSPLNPLVVKSDYIGGMILKSFSPSWEGFKNPKHPGRKPHYKNLEEPVATLINAQNPVKLLGSKKVKIKQIEEIEVVNQKQYDFLYSPDIKICKYYSLSKEPSGYYLSVSYEQKKPKARPKQLIAGIDPGVKVIIALDNGYRFNPNKHRDNYEEKIAKLQQKLSKLVLVNNKLLGRSEKHPANERTKNEQKIYAKIARLHEKARNTTKAFNQKLSTRIARTFSEVDYEKTAIKNLMSQCEDKMDETGHHHPNGASAKSGLNHSLKMRSLGQLKAMIKAKVESRGNTFVEVDAPYSSKICHNCDVLGDRPTQESFFCKNPNCELHGIEQNADTNAAKNLKIGDVKKRFHAANRIIKNKNK